MVGGIVGWMGDRMSKKRGEGVVSPSILYPCVCFSIMYRSSPKLLFHTVLKNCLYEFVPSNVF